ncbi:MAG TPA: hypothetical protein VK683_06700, partial [Rhizomicrobium sp.]|nr:hypothetical protein [Rhizomicrobium sp.]
NFSWGGDDSGTVTAAGGNGLRFVSDLTHRETLFGYALLRDPPAAAVLALGGNAGQSAITLTTPGTSLSMLVGTPGGGIAGHWFTNTPAAGPLDATATALDIAPDGHYHYRFRFSEAGTFQAADGKWIRSRPGAPPVNGNYTFYGNDRVKAAGGGGTTMWVRSG